MERPGALEAWLAEAGLAGMPVERLLAGFCERLLAEGVPVARAHISMAALHPLIDAYSHTWTRTGGVASETFGHAPSRGAWRESPFRHMVENAVPLLRRPLAGPQARHDYPVFARLAAEGYTDWVGIARGFGPELGMIRADGPPIALGMVSSWASDRPGGFGESAVRLEAAVPLLSLAVKAATTARLARTILDTYVGGDAAGHVMSGEIRRGMARRIAAVILYADLRGFTALADALEIEPLVALLDQYFDCLGAAIAARGGQVLKFLGDGMLASFRLAPGADAAPACTAALEAARAGQAAVAALNATRRRENLPFVGFDIALHLGEVMYGNVGTAARLDFTLIGPAVNEAARMEGMCAALGLTLVASRPFRDAAGAAAAVLEPLGTHRLRGIAEERELFGLRA